MQRQARVNCDNNPGSCSVNAVHDAPAFGFIAGLGKLINHYRDDAICMNKLEKFSSIDANFFFANQIKRMKETPSIATL